MSATQSCPTLCNLMACSLPGSSVHGISQARILEWVAISFPRGIFPTQGWNFGLLHCGQILYCLRHKGSPTASDKNDGIPLSRLGHCDFRLASSLPPAGALLTL